MAKKKISIIFGTRPEAIKLAPVISQLKQVDGIECKVCITAQHRHMLDQVLDIFNISPDTDLNLMEHNQTLSGFTAKAIIALDLYMTKEKPDLILIQGDTTTVFCAALTAFYHKVPIGHIEAGLRTGDIYSPWPEEINRQLATRLTSLHFAPTKSSKENLLKENVDEKKIYITGNTVIDALYIATKTIQKKLPEIPGITNDMFISWDDKPVILITGHRRENFGEGFKNICNAIAELARRFPEAHFVYPVHLNPNVREPVERILGTANQKLKNIHLIEPIPYLSFCALMNRAYLILTDSGGVQEEAPSLGKPVLVMRKTTERPEGIQSGSVRLVGTDYSTIVEEVSRLLTDKNEYKKMSKAQNPYGDGKASERIKYVVLRLLGLECKEVEMWEG